MIDHVDNNWSVTEIRDLQIRVRLHFRLSHLTLTYTTDHQGLWERNLLKFDSHTRTLI